MLSNHFWDGFVLGALLLILGAFLMKNLFARARAKRQAQS